MKLYARMIAPVIYYPDKNYVAQKKYIEDPVHWYPEEMEQELRDKYEREKEWANFDFDVMYVEYAKEPKFKKLKVPEKCADCKSCSSEITGIPYCGLECFSSKNQQTDISTIYVNANTRPSWCPIIKLNESLDRMPIEQRSNFDAIITGFSSLWGTGDWLDEVD